MTPATCASLRRAAALLHAVPGLRATVLCGGQRLATVSPCAGSDCCADAEAATTAHRIGARICSPCQFRRTIIAACAHLAIGDEVGLFGLPIGMDPRLELFTEETCRMSDDGIVSWLLGDGTSVLCFATLLDVETALVAAGSDRPVRSSSHAERAETGTPVALGRRGTRIDFFRDDDLAVTLVYATLVGDDVAARTRATGALIDLMALYGAEEIAADPSLLMTAAL